jgi:hypothetical protein
VLRDARSALLSMTGMDLSALRTQISDSNFKQQEAYDRILAARCARALRYFPPSHLVEGAGKAGCALHPRSRVQRCAKKRTRAYRSSGGDPAFPAQWFTTYFVLSPVNGLCCHRRLAARAAKLSASIAAPGPHDFAVRRRLRSSSAAIRVHRISPRVRDVRNAPLIG